MIVSPAGLRSRDMEKQPVTDTNVDVDKAMVGEPSTELHRGLKARHISMIAIGGAIGTGLIIGTGSALAAAGPLAVLIAYSLVGLLVYIVMTALGEMSAWLPLGSGFTGYATRFCDPALGFALGWTYWFKYIIVVPNQLTAAALVIQYWLPAEKVNPGVWVAIFLVIVICINYFGVKFFGEFEFWLSSFKVMVIVGLMILSLVLILGGGPDHDRKGFRYWRNPGAIKEYKNMTGASGRFVAVWASMVTAVFAYLGTELVGVTVGEAQNPRRVIPKAIKLTFVRIVIFYVILSLFLGMLVPYNSELLTFNSSKSDASASPFVVAIQLAGIKALPDIMNVCILMFVLSAANSDLYIASRTLYGLASEGRAPFIFSKTNKNHVPVYSLGISALFALLAFMNVSSSSKKVFGYFVNLVSAFGICCWISILVTHVYFVRARKAQGVDKAQMAYTAPLGMWGSLVALFFACLIAITKNFSVFMHGDYGNFDYKNFITSYLAYPIYLGCIAGYKFSHWDTPAPKPHEVDLFSGKDKIDREEEEFMAWEASREDVGMRKIYNKYISWLF